MPCNLLMQQGKIGPPRPVYEPRGREFESLRARQNTRPPAMGAFLICLTDVIRLTEYETSQKNQPFESQRQTWIALG